jgi:hypothetical protein
VFAPGPDDLDDVFGIEAERPVRGQAVEEVLVSFRAELALQQVPE